MQTNSTLTIGRTIGKQIKETESFGGSVRYLTIERIEYHPESFDIQFFGRDPFGHKSSIYFPKSRLNDLLVANRAEMDASIEPGGPNELHYEWIIR